jgi:hypothetical protein
MERISRSASLASRLGSKLSAEADVSTGKRHLRFRVSGVRCRRDYLSMRGEQQWPSQERLLSPVIALLLLALLVTAVIAVLRAEVVAVMSVIVAALAVSGWEEQIALDRLDRFERRYAKSRYVAGRLKRRARWRALVRTVQPKVSAVARVSLLATAALVLLIMVAAQSHSPVAHVHPPAWIVVARLFARGVVLAAVASVLASTMMRSAVRGWDADAASPLSPMPVVTSREFLRKLNRPAPRTLAAVIALALSLVLSALH